MKRFFTLTSLLILLALVVPTFAADEKKDAKKDDPPAVNTDDKKDPKKDEKQDAEQKKKEEREKAKELKEAREKEKALLSGFSFVGKLIKVDGNSQGDFTVEVRVPYTEYNQAEANAAAQDQARIMQIMANPAMNPLQRQQQLAQASASLAQHQSRIYQTKYKTQPIDLRAAETMKVRTAKPPIEYDEKGKVKKFTQKELKELRGSGILPGYISDVSNLQNNQMVKVYLAKKKNAKGEEKMAGKKDKDGDKGLAAADKKGKKKNEFDDLGLERPEVVLIVIMLESPQMKGQ
jgi:hypothetical protein